MLMNLSLVSLSMSYIFWNDVTNVISPIWYINFAKIHANSEIILSITLLFDKILSLVKIFQ